MTSKDQKLNVRNVEKKSGILNLQDVTSAIKKNGIEGIRNRIINSDCIEIMKELPDKSVDLIVTDPPYNMNYSGRGKVNSFENFKNDDLDEEEHSEWFDSILKELYRILKDDKAIYIWIDFRNYARIYNLVKKYFSIKNCIVWDKGSIGMGQHFRFQHEFLVF